MNNILEKSYIFDILFLILFSHFEHYLLNLLNKYK